MKARDREGFARVLRAKRADGASLDEAILAAYAWLLKPSSKAFAGGGVVFERGNATVISFGE